LEGVFAMGFPLFLEYKKIRKKDLALQNTFISCRTFEPNQLRMSELGERDIASYLPSAATRAFVGAFPIIVLPCPL
jgi:hypothetical protein